MVAVASSGNESVPHADVRVLFYVVVWWFWGKGLEGLRLRLDVRLGIGLRALEVDVECYQNKRGIGHGLGLVIMFSTLGLGFGVGLAGARTWACFLAIALARAVFLGAIILLLRPSKWL